MGTVVYQRSIATLSWIDPRAGLPEYDSAGEPAASLDWSHLTEAHNCRFSHVLTASVRVDDGKIAARWVDEKRSGLFARPSAFDTPAVLYPRRRDITDWTQERAVFVQTVGCRTQAPELVGGAVGGAGGGGMRWPVGLGERIGREAAEYFSSFPPIWTRLKLVIFASGYSEYSLVSHSAFPSITWYTGANVNQMTDGQIKEWRKQSSYDGVPQYKHWTRNGWGKEAGAGQGNPWGVASPAGVRNDRIR